ncbi:hypothetical protein PAMC26510_08285 [Caballeronia sordidicola]|uniref:Uncharacterized protein n=1 Tax=Caballeronia sordidicola TaxID=196367 RepID=A0A242N3D2_CABSO|nr:hypothetical protein PAMC26510_08285 [Caballeronia sordidicola]
MGTNFIDLPYAFGPTFFECHVERTLGGTAYFAQNSTASRLGYKRSEDKNLG